MLDIINIKILCSQIMNSDINNNTQFDGCDDKKEIINSAYVLNNKQNNTTVQQRILIVDDEPFNI